MGSKKTVVRITEAAKLVGLHPSTLRRLEQRKLVVPARTWANHRRYSQEDLARLRQLAGLA